MASPDPDNVIAAKAENLLLPPGYRYPRSCHHQTATQARLPRNRVILASIWANRLVICYLGGFGGHLEPKGYRQFDTCRSALKPHAKG